MFSEVKPKILPITFGESPIFAGQAVQVACIVLEGDHPLEIVWHYPGKGDMYTLGVTTVKVGETANMLQIATASSVNSGKYTCVAKNSAGIAKYSAELHVTGNLS